MSILQYRLRNVQPLRITDESTSQTGQMTSLRYIPGSAVRGMIIAKLSKESGFEGKKIALFSDATRFLNAYPVADGQDAVPSPKGFYEGKSEEGGKIRNILFDDTAALEGRKRASLGLFSYSEGDALHYLSVETGSDLKIKINVDTEQGEKKNVFRNEYIVPGYLFSGCIVAEEEIIAEIGKIFKEGDAVYLGNARSYGLGKCVVEKIKVMDQFPEAADLTDSKGACVIALSSPMTMLDEKGEICGINLATLAQRMQVSNLNIETCATSVRLVRGFNRTLGGEIPSAKMYDMGSTFLLTFDGVLTKERKQELLLSGIGIRKNEGFGQIRFPKDYEKTSRKVEAKPDVSVSGPVNDETLSAENTRTLRDAARRCYSLELESAIRKYVVDHGSDFNGEGLATSQFGTLEALITQNRYSPNTAEKVLRDYLNHAQDKDIKKTIVNKRASIRKLKERIESILNHDLDAILGDALSMRLSDQAEIFGIPRKELLSQEEVLQWKLELLLSLIRHSVK